MPTDVSNWIALVSAVTAFISYLEAKKATNKSESIDDSTAKRFNPTLLKKWIL